MLIPKKGEGATRVWVSDLKGSKATDIGSL